MSKATPVEVAGVEAGNAVWSANRPKPSIKRLDLREVEGHPDNMRNAGGGTVFGVILKDDTLDAEELIPQIVAAGGLTERPVVSVRKDGKKVMLRGHRRKAAVSKMLNDTSFAMSEELRKAIEKVDCDVYEGLTEAQEADMLQDQNSKPYSGSQDMVWFWNMLKTGYTFRSLLERILSRKGNATDEQSKVKRAEVKSMTGKTREDYLFNWFKGTYQYYYKNAFDLGPKVQAAALLSERVKEFPQSEMPYFFTCTTQYKKINSQVRINELVTACNTDKANGQWNPLSGGPTFNAAVEKFHAEDFDSAGNVIKSAPVEAKKPAMSAEELKTRISSAQSDIERACWTMASGTPVADFGTHQNLASVLEGKRKAYNNVRLKLPAEKQKLLDLIFNASFEDFEKALNAQFTA